ncbi:Uncharacterised protein [Capnocytophaga sputigena]|uniref:Uncharacterized protein n=1 Tax=Capnocytophaga sputigena TaxID=1019 RepID=A0AAX2IDU9_CAPSP|nr:Uncharacterised protein [Capnocytophaga sputigena]
MKKTFLLIIDVNKKSPPIVLQKANMITLLKTFMMIAS